MRIDAPGHFRNPSELAGPNVAKDPRASDFVESSVVIDLRHCGFVRPPAALWCLTYPLLAAKRGSACTLLVPEDMGVCVYLQSLGLFETLKQHGVEVDDRDVRYQSDPKLILPFSHFETEYQVEEVTNKALDRLSKRGHGSRQLHPLVGEVFAEIALNAVQHAESPIGAYGFIQFYEFEQGERFVCGVADGGIGIRKSLEKNPDLRDRVHYDWSAIELALRERVSGTGDRTRGIGLYGVAEDMRVPGRQLLIHSGIGSLQLSEEVESSARRTSLFPGTALHVSIPA